MRQVPLIPSPTARRRLTAPPSASPATPAVRYFLRLHPSAVWESLLWLVNPSLPLPPAGCRCLNLRCTDASSCRSLSNNITVVVVDDCPAPACTAPGDVQLNSFAFRHAAAR